MVQRKRIRLVYMRMQIRFLALFSGLGSSAAVSCGVGRRCGLDLALLWLWHRPATTALIRPLGWEPPYATLEKDKKTKKRKKKKKERNTENRDTFEAPPFYTGFVMSFLTC